MLIEDLRDDGYKMSDIRLFMDVLHIPTPLINSKTTNLRKFEDVDIPKKMLRRAADLDRLEGPIKPDQMAANAISDQISRAQAVSPPFTPYHTADFLAPPWIPSESEHTGVRKIGLPESLVSDSSNPIPSTAGF